MYCRKGNLNISFLILVEAHDHLHFWKSIFVFANIFSYTWLKFKFVNLGRKKYLILEKFSSWCTTFTSNFINNGPRFLGKPWNEFSFWHCQWVSSRLNQVTLIYAVWFGSHCCWGFAEGRGGCWNWKWQAGEGIHGERKFGTQWNCRNGISLGSICPPLHDNQSPEFLFCYQSDPDFIFRWWRSGYLNPIP